MFRKKRVRHSSFSSFDLYKTKDNKNFYETHTETMYHSMSGTFPKEDDIVITIINFLIDHLSAIGYNHGLYNRYKFQYFRCWCKFRFLLYFKWNMNCAWTVQNSMLWSNQLSTKVNFSIRNCPLKIAYSCFKSVARHSQNKLNKINILNLNRTNH